MNYKLSEIINFMENWAPIQLAESWDNSGLQIGDINSEVGNILIGLDVDKKVLDHINQESCDLVITHHPLFFKPIKQIVEFDVGKIARAFIKKGVNLYSAHTNLDVAKDGVNDCLIKAFNLNPENGSNFINSSGKWFKSKKGFDTADLFKYHKGHLLGAQPKTKVNTVAFGCGSGKSMLTALLENNIELLITGELGYHEHLFCELNNIAVYSLGHKESEVFVLAEIKERIQKQFKNTETTILY